MACICHQKQEALATRAIENTEIAKAVVEIGKTSDDKSLKAKPNDVTEVLVVLGPGTTWHDLPRWNALGDQMRDTSERNVEYS